MSKCVLLLKEKDVISVKMYGENNNTDIVDFWIKMTEEVFSRTNKGCEDKMAATMHWVVDYFKEQQIEERQ